MDLELRRALRDFRTDPTVESYNAYREKALRAKLPVSCYFCEKGEDNLAYCEEHLIGYCRDCGNNYSCRVADSRRHFGGLCPHCTQACSICKKKRCNIHAPYCEICQIDLRDPVLCSDCAKQCWECGRQVCLTHLDAGVCVDCLRERGSRRNPDDELRNLERDYQASSDANLLQQLAAKLRRAGQEEQADILEQSHLKDALDAYYEAFWNFSRLRDTFTPDHSSEHPQYLALVQAKIVLTEKSKELNLRPGYHCYRPYHHIPYINEHILGLAFLNDAMGVPEHRDGPQVWRNDDGYFGRAIFPSLFDTENFKEDMIRNRYVERGYGLWVTPKLEGFKVEWEIPK